MPGIAQECTASGAGCRGSLPGRGATRHAEPRSGDFSAARFFRYRAVDVPVDGSVLARYDDGTVALLRAAQILGERVHAGWTPEAEIVLAFWDAEEHGLIGSTEWGEALAQELRAEGGAAEGTAAHLVLLAAQPWSQQTHALFPVAARARVAELLLLGHGLARAFACEKEAALLDVWMEVVVPLAVSRAA